MLITICSDIHDNIWKLADALPGMNDGDLLIFCGDFCAPFTLAQLAEGFQGPVHVVWGNNDGDARLLSQVAAAAGNVTLHGELAELNVEGFKVAVNHYPEIAVNLAASGRYDLVCYGHDHTVKCERIGETWLVNPGEMMGRFGRSSYIIFDTSTKTPTVRDA
jgi:putative phosphoesterase